MYSRLLSAVGGELGVDVLSRVVVLPLRELGCPAESLSTVLKELCVRGASSPPLGQRLIVVAARRVQAHVAPQAKRGADGVVGVPAQLWRREVRAPGGCPALRRRVQALRRGEVRRVGVPQERGGGGEEVQGPRGGARFPGSAGGERRGGRLGGVTPVPAVALLALVRHRVGGGGGRGVHVRRARWIIAANAPGQSFSPGKFPRSLGAAQQRRARRSTFSAGARAN